MRWPTCFTIASPVSTYRSILRACARKNSLTTGKKIHAIITTTGLFTPSTFLRNTLLHVYASSGQIHYAHKLFDEIPHSYKDTVDWTTLMSCLCNHNSPNHSLKLFIEMQKYGVKLDDLTLVCFFNACARLRDNMAGVQGHGCMVKMGFGGGVKTCNAMMDVYVKCGLVGEAKRLFEEMGEKKSVVSWTVILDGVVRDEGVERGMVVFDEMPERNEVAWTIMIVSCFKSGFTREGFTLLAEMIFDVGFELNHVTLCSLLSVSVQSGDVITGKWVHVYALKAMKKKMMNTMVSTSLIDMYAKCGRINYAIRVFDMMPERNVVTWNAMISGLAMHGHGLAVLDMFTRMIKEAKPDEVTFTSVLSACSHAGLVDEGKHVFNNMESKYGIRPEMDHYACMVDLLARAGRLEEAESLINQMPFCPNEVVLGSLVGSCSVYGKLQLGERTLKRLIRIYPDNTEYHILLSNMYVLGGKSDQANSLRHVLHKRGIKKMPGVSFIHVTPEDG